MAGLLVETRHANLATSARWRDQSRRPLSDEWHGFYHCTTNENRLSGLQCDKSLCWLKQWLFVHVSRSVLLRWDRPAVYWGQNGLRSLLWDKSANCKSTALWRFRLPMSTMVSKLCWNRWLQCRRGLRALRILIYPRRRRQASWSDTHALLQSVRQWTDTRRRFRCRSDTRWLLTRDVRAANELLFIHTGQCEGPKLDFIPKERQHFQLWR